MLDGLNIRHHQTFPPNRLYHLHASISASVMQYAGHTPPDELRRRARRYLSALP